MAVSPKSEKSRKRKYISVHTNRYLLRKADDCCEYVSSSGKRCGTKYQVQKDHRQALALGGTNEVTNLRMFCRTHNLLAARQAGLIHPKNNAKRPRSEVQNTNIEIKD